MVEKRQFALGDTVWTKSSSGRSEIKSGALEEWLSAIFHRKIVMRWLIGIKQVTDNYTIPLCKITTTVQIIIGSHFWKKYFNSVTNRKWTARWLTSITSLPLQVLDYRDLIYYGPRNTGIDKRFNSIISKFDYQDFN